MCLVLLAGDNGTVLIFFITTLFVTIQVERAGDNGTILATPPQVKVRKVRHKPTHNLKERRTLKAKEGHTLKGKVGHTLKGKVGRLRVNLGMVHSRSASLSLCVCIRVCVLLCVRVCNELICTPYSGL